jgi:hypothetical protein
MKPVEEHADVLGQGIVVDRPFFLEVLAARGVVDLCGMEDQRWVVLDARRRANVFGELWEIVLGNSTPARLLDFLLYARALLVIGHRIDQSPEVDLVVPDVQRRHKGVLRHVFPV